MKKLIVLSMMLVILGISESVAKRTVPSKVLPVQVGNIEYSAPHGKLQNQMGCIEARKVGSGELLWRRQIYVVKYDPDLEGDVQDVYIKNFKVKGNSLMITNERKSEYQLNLNTLQVKVLKGSLVEETNF
jgi:hypothetical protein